MSPILFVLFFVLGASAGAGLVLIASQPPGEGIANPFVDRLLGRSRVWAVTEATGRAELQDELNRLERKGYTIARTLPSREGGRATCVLAFRAGSSAGRRS